MIENKSKYLPEKNVLFLKEKSCNNNCFFFCVSEAMMYVNGRRHFQQAMGLSYPETRA